MNTEFDRYIEHKGGVSDAATSLGITSGMVSHLRKGVRTISAQVALNISKDWPDADIQKLLAFGRDSIGRITDNRKSSQ